MAIRDILIYPEPTLKEVSRQVTELTSEVLAIAGDLVDTMKASPGVGLAAVQIGVPLRIIAVDVTPRNPGHGLLVLVNPEIKSTEGRKKVREGCLSVPEYTANITRAEEVAITAMTPEGKEVELHTKGFEAIALQHEIDHLDGILFIDRIANMKRDLFRRKKG